MINFNNKNLTPYFSPNPSTPSTVHEALNDPKVSGELLVKTLSFDPMLKKCFSLSAGVTEGYTVGEHTILVLDTAIKHRDVIEPCLPQPITWQDFLFFLSLHDIGKGEAALSNNNNTNGNSLSFKHDELKNTRKILRQIMKDHQMAPEKIQIFSQLLYKDSQGLYLRDFTSEHELFTDIVHFSYRCSLAPLDFYSLLKAYHLADAASYPTLKPLFEWHPILQHSPANTKKIALIENMLTQAVQGEKVFDELEKELNPNGFTHFNPDKVRNLLLRNITNLYHYVQRTHILYRRHPAKFHDIPKRIFTLIGIAFYILGQRNEKDFEQAYNELLKEGPKKDLCQRTNPVEKVAHLFNYPSSDQPNINTVFSVSIFIDAIIHLRQCYFTREKALTLDNVASKILTSGFWHGTNSNMLLGLPRTQFKILPFGFLQRLNILPLSGECNKGTEGVSLQHVSGTALEAISTAINYYATNDQWHIDLDVIEKTGQNFIEYWNEDNLWFYIDKVPDNPFDNSNIYPNLYFRNNIGIPLKLERYKHLYPKDFEAKQPILIEISKLLKYDIKYYEQSITYKELLPKDQGGEYPDNYYYQHYKTAKTISEKLEKVVTSNVDKQEIDLNFIKDQYPIVWGSTTLVPRITSSFNAAERVIGSAKIGKDYNLAATDENHVDALKDYLKKYGLEGKVTVVTFSQIEEVVENHYPSISSEIHNFLGLILPLKQ